LLKSGYGITNVVQRATATADQLSRDELRKGCAQITAKVLRYKPRFLAILGLGAYRTAWERPKAVIGRQAETIGDTKIWVLPNPSGLNAHYQAKQLAQLFAELKTAVDALE
jgi:TDG/mug DNA glycosylase family protein